MLKVKGIFGKALLTRWAKFISNVEQDQLRGLMLEARERPLERGMACRPEA